MPISDNTYSVNWNKLISWLTPSVLFKPKIFALLKSIVAPISLLQGEFIGYRYQVNYELSITGQVCRLEKLLNDRYDPVDRRIYISNGNPSPKKFAFKQNEFVPQPVYTEPENVGYFIFQEGEITQQTYHFNVNVPVGLAFDENEFKSVLNAFKMPAKKYTIETF